MRLEQPNKNTCPVGLINECELLARAPERAKEILDKAIRIREREHLYNKEIRGLLTLHPLHTTRVALIVGIVTFVLAMILSEIVAFGRWYAQLKSLSISLPVPLVGNESLNFGGLLPTSTSLGIASVLPSFGLREALFLAIGVMVALLLEKVIVAALHVKETHTLKTYDNELANELRVLRDWRKNY